MSVMKLLGRIIAPDIADANGETLHDHTYGLTSAPLIKFACVFSALIHDADHIGVSNAQLLNEHARIASHYRGQSIAEQNSIDLCWQLLMEDRFSNFRAAIYSDEEELKRFRALVTNSVLAVSTIKDGGLTSLKLGSKFISFLPFYKTDIMDKELKQLRNNRWDKAFSETPREESKEDDSNRKATIVIEHIIQASDVSHLMQHWHIYRKWNERLFQELYFAHKVRRTNTS
jgi:3'5'-cyclic nucleotide phosphodiesterase